MYQIQERIFYS